ncbi:MAG: hypothetical protein JXA09_03355 [Anaerolineae bacterium]|nr:hypothetical protein [Anaerolineae bacterium]
MKVTLFDRYVHEVGRRLPQRMRADVQAELHSLLMDALQDRVGELPEKGEVAEADQVAVLEVFGPPARVVEGYMPPKRYVIGPRLYDIYRIVVAAVTGALTIAHLVLLGLALWGESDPAGGLASALGNVFDSYLGAVLAGLGSVTVTFYVLERVLPESALERDEAAWDPRKLPPVQDRARIEVGGLIVESVLMVIALVVFNFFPQWVGVAYVGSLDGGKGVWHATPMLAPVFVQAYLPMLNVLWLLRIGLNVVLVQLGRWQRWTRAIDLVLALFGVYVLSRMLFGPSLLAMEAIEPASLRETLTKILGPMLRVGLGIGLVATVGEVVQKGVRLVRSELRPDYLSPDEGAPAA